KLSDARLSPGAGFEPADLAVTCPEGTPTCAAGRHDLVCGRPGSRGSEGRCSGALPVELRHQRDGGTRTRNLRMKEEPSPAQQADPTVKVRDNRRDIGVWLRGHGSNADLLVQDQAWCQFHHLASVWTEGLEPPTPGFRRRCAR